MSTFNTVTLKQAVECAIKGAGFDKHLEISSDIGIRVSEGKLELNTTDGENYLMVKCPVSHTEDIDITVNADTFSKLISKITSDTVELEAEGNTLKVNGNGNYTLALIPDESGNLLSFPNRFPEEAELVGKIAIADLEIISTAIKASLSDVASSIYSSYYVGDIVASTDRAMLSALNKQILNTPYLFSRKFVDLMCLGKTDVTLLQGNGLLVAKSEFDTISIFVCAKAVSEVADFNLGALMKFLQMDVTSFCRVRKNDLLSLLDRLSLFVNKFDVGAVTLHFTNDHLEVSTINSAGIECIDYLESKEAQDLTVKINIGRLLTQLKAYTADTVDLWYGSDKCIKLIDGEVSQIIALMT